MTGQQLGELFSYQTPTDGQVERYRTIREAARGLAGLVNELCPNSRETSLAITNIQQAVLWANASIGIHGDAQAHSLEGPAEYQPPPNADPLAPESLAQLKQGGKPKR